MVDREPAHRGRVGDVGRQAQVDVGDRHVVGHPHHERGDVEVVARGLEVGAARPLDPGVTGGDGLAHPGERSEVRDERGRGLVADALDPRQPVAGVAAQRGHVGVGVTRGDGVLVREEGLGHDVGVAHPTTGGVDDPRARGVVDELEQVAVARDDVDRHLPAVRHGERADDVVGLVAGGADAGDANGSEGLGDDRHLRAELVGDLLALRGVVGDAVRLVGRDRVDPPLRPPVVVPARHDVGGAVAGDERGDHVEESGHGIGRDARRHLGPRRHAVEGAEVQGGGVEQEQAGRRVGHALTLRLSLMLHPWKRRIDRSSTSCARTDA